MSNVKLTLDPREAWQELVRRYADGRKICNCGDAYCREDGACPFGCSANLLAAKREIAQRVLEELENLK